MANNSKFLIGKKSYFEAQTDNKYETFSKGLDTAINAAASSYQDKGGLFPGDLPFEDVTTETTTTTTTIGTGTTTTTTTA